jgi:TonB-linked SusC/RagA family outer membrane protein
MRSFVTTVVCGLGLLFFAPGLAFGQTGTIAGTVTASDTDDSLPGATVRIVETDAGTATNADGEFRIPGVSVGEKTVRVSFVGYRPVERVVNVSAGQTTTLDFELSPAARELNEVVVTGVSSETPQANLSFKVDQVSSEELSEAPGTSPLESLKGKIAGASINQTSGAPGSGFDVVLRGATSISGDNEPLYIVDGVILGASQVDIGSLDIKNIEVVKGAAASSLYGSRAQNGVINITTQDGSGGEIGETRVTVRSEFGIQSLRETPTTNESHAFATNDDNVLIDSEGNEIEYGRDVVAVANGPNGTTFFNRPYEDLRKPDGSSYNLTKPFETFFDPGNTSTQHISVSRNAGDTNFNISFTNTREEGVVDGPVSADGYQRRNYRLNLDHRPNDNWTISATGAYASSTNDDITRTDADPFFDLYFTQPLADLTARDDQGELVIEADPRAIEANPLYPIENLQRSFERERFLGSLQLEYSPFSWGDLSGQLSYDRSDRLDEEFYPIGYKTTLDEPRNEGEIERQYFTEEALNANVTASVAQDFGDLTTRAQARFQIERTDFLEDFIQGTELSAQGVTRFDAVLGEKTTESSFSEVRSEGYYLTASGDYDDRYILDLLVRRDGSSLFGADERWQTYYRAAGAYRLSEEAFWPLEGTVSDFKLRYSYGTAGGRPPFEAQYQTFNIDGGTSPTKETQGNADLKPEFQVEQEFGVEMSLFDRVFIDVTYADVTVEDQILRVPLPASSGFEAQWQNAGTIESQTWELGISGDILRQQDLNWRAGLTFDRTRQEITEYDANPIRVGPDQQKAFYIREGEELGAMYGVKFIESRAGLEQMGFDPAKFQENDDGYYVPVGTGNSWRDGFEEELWGTDVTVEDRNGETRTLEWGVPVQLEKEDGSTFQKIGSTLPDFNANFNTSLQYKGFRVYTLLSAQVGGDVYNATRQWGVRDDRAAQVDQAGVPQPRQKPQAYYQALYATNAKTSEFVEDATFLKVRELSLGYTFGQSQLDSWIGDSNVVDEISLRVVGRNLFSFDSYRGLDPEVGGGTEEEFINGNSNIFRIDNFAYPKFRTFTGRIEVKF